MSLTAVVQALVESGATPEMILAVVRATEASQTAAIDARRASDAERQRRRREKGERHVTSRDVTVTDRDPPLETKGVPEPLPKTQNPTTPPIVPPTSRPEADLAAVLAKQIHQMQPKAYRRSAVADVLRGVRANLNRGAKPDELILGCKTYYARPDCLEDEGRYAKGAAVLLAANRWREHLPRPEPPRVVTPAAMAHRLEHYRSTGEWRPDWGEIPNEAAA